MSEEKWAIITGADGGMGTEITRAVAEAGYHIIMACYRPSKAEPIRQRLVNETGNVNLEVMAVDLSSMASTASFADRIVERHLPVSLLMNNAGTMETGLHITDDGFERTVSVNYLGPYLLTRKLLPALTRGARIVNMVSCTYAIGHLPVYSNTKLALMLFTIELSERLREKGITVNAADPGIVSTDIITMHQWFDPLTDIFFRPFIRTPKKGASTAVGLLLDEAVAGVSGQLYASNRRKELSDNYIYHVQKEQLWEITEQLLAQWFT